MFIWLFNKKQKRSLGIDIGTSLIKIVELSNIDERWKLENYAIYDVGGNSSEKNDVIQTSSLKMLDNEVVNIIGSLMDQAKFQVRNAVFAIPVFSTFTTLIELPSMSREEIDKAIKFEARQYIPIPIKDVVYDWDFVGMSRFRGTGDKASKKLEKAKIILVAVPKEVINKYSNIAKALKLNLKGLESENFSLIRSLIGNDPSPSCIIDIGSRNTNVTIIDKGVLVLSHNIETSGIDFTRVIVKGMSVDSARAEEMKRKEGLVGFKEIGSSVNKGFVDLKGEKEVAKILMPIVDIIASEAERMMDGYLKKHDRNVDKIVLTGGSSNLPGLGGYLSQKLKKAVFIGNPWSRIIYPKDLEGVLRSRSASFSVAIGAAMRKI